MNLNPQRQPEPGHWLDPVVAQARRRLLRSWQVAAITDAIAEHPEGSQLGVGPEVAAAVDQALAAAATRQFQSAPPEHLQFEAFVRTMILDLLRAK